MLTVVANETEPTGTQVMYRSRKAATRRIHQRTIHGHAIGPKRRLGVGQKHEESSSFPKQPLNKHKQPITNNKQTIKHIEEDKQ